MAHGGFGRRVEQVQVDRMAGKRLQGEGGNELAPALGHHHPNFGAMVAQATDQFGALVGGDAAADAQDDAFTIQPLHRPALLSGRDVRSENQVRSRPVPRKNDGLR